jgi:putative inorganic carbon (HCO3(-)) transporter
MAHQIRAIVRCLAASEFLVVAVFAAASVLFEQLSPAVLAVACAFWLVRRLACGRFGVRTPADWSIGLLALTVPVSLWITVWPDVTAQQAYRLLVGIALYYSIANWACSRARLSWLAWGLLLVGCALALSAPLTMQPLAVWRVDLRPPSFVQSLSAHLSEGINPNVMAGVLVVLLPFSMGMLLFNWRHLGWAVRIAAGLATFLMLLALYVTRSRGAVIGLSAAMFVMVALRWRRGWLFGLAVSLSVVFAGWLLGPVRVVTALTTTPALSGLDVRLEVWSRALYMIQDFPFTGIGFGSFAQMANLLYPFYLVSPETLIPHAHNLFLQVAVDLGLVGLVAWLAAWLLAGVAAWTGYRQSKLSRDDLLTGICASVLGSQAALAGHGISDAVTWGTRPALLVWAIWGLAAASMLICRQK